MRDIAAAARGNGHTDAGGVNGFDVVSVGIPIGAAFEFVFNLILMASARNTVGIKADMYGLVSLSTYAPNNGKPQFVSSRTLAHYYLQEGLDHNQVPLKHTIDTLSKLNVAPDQPLELLTSMLPSFVKAVGMGPDVLKNNRNYLSKLYLLQDEFLGLGIMKRK